MNATLSPVMALSQQWEAANAATADADVSEAEFDTRVRRATDLQDRILATPGTSQADFVAKVAAYTAFGRDELATSAMAALL